jgi:hypothetical protein
VAKSLAGRNVATVSEAASAARSSSLRYVQCAIAPTSAAAIARKSQAKPTGAPWKLPHERTRPSGSTIGLSIAERSSARATRSQCASVSRAAPATCGEHRSE